MLSKNNRKILNDVVIMAIAYDEPEVIRVDGHIFRNICGRTPVYRCTKLGLIVKRPAFIYHPNTPMKVRVPTIGLKEKSWVAQPVVKKINLKKAVDIIRKQLGKAKADLHYLNVGWYNGKAVMFDW